MVLGKSASMAASQFKPITATMMKNGGGWQEERKGNKEGTPMDDNENNANFLMQSSD